MKSCQKYFSTCLLGIAALLVGASPAWAQVSLGAASNFSVLGTTVTCVGPGSVIGDVGATTTFTPGACTFEGGTPPAITSSAAVLAQAALTTAYNDIRNGDCTPLTLANTGTTVGRNLSTLAGVTLAPGTYCIEPAAKTGLLTLNGPSNGIWIFKVLDTADGALTGTNFTVTMTGGGQPCNVFWAPVHAATMTTSAFKGNILAGNLTDGSITTTGGTLIGRALANVAVSMTGPSVVGCGALPGLAGTPSCKPGKRLVCKKKHGHDGGKGKDDDDDDGDDDDDEDDGGKNKGKNVGKPLSTNWWFEHILNKLKK